MRRTGDDARIAKALASADYAERAEGVVDFARSLGMSAHVALALEAAEHPEACRSWSGEGALVEHLLAVLPLPEEVAIAWSVALCEGEALRKALECLDRRVGAELRAILSARGLDGDEAWQSFLAQLVSSRGLRQSSLGKFSGRGGLASYLATAVMREAVRQSSRKARALEAPAEALEALPGTSEPPSASAERREMLDRLAEVFGDLADDPGLSLFLLQQTLDLAPSQMARAFRMKENLVRQRTFRFRERFRRAWRSRHGESEMPIPEENGT